MSQWTSPRQAEGKRRKFRKTKPSTCYVQLQFEVCRLTEKQVTLKLIGQILKQLKSINLLAHLFFSASNSQLDYGRMRRGQTYQCRFTRFTDSNRSIWLLFEQNLRWAKFQNNLPVLLCVLYRTHLCSYVVRRPTLCLFTEQLALCSDFH